MDSKDLGTGIPGSNEDPLATIKRERDWLHVLLDNLTDGVAACDSDGVLTLLNGAAQEFHGRPFEAVHVRDWIGHHDLYLPDGVTPLGPDDIPLNRALEGEEVSEVELVIAPQGRPHRLVAVSGKALFGSGGAKLGAVTVMHDLTERKRAEAAEIEVAASRATEELRKKEALRINDQVIQALVTAAWTWEEDAAKARSSLTKALDSAKDIVGGLIGELTSSRGELSAGALRATDPAEQKDG